MFKSIAVSAEGMHNTFARSSEQSVKAYFGKVRSGNSENYQTSFYRGVSTDDLLNRWSKRLKVIGDAWPSLLEFENDLKAKVGPLSVMRPLSERMDDIDAYFTGVTLPATPIAQSALKAVISEYSAAKGTQPRIQWRTLEKMKLSTNSGNPWFQRRSTVIDKTVPAFMQQEELSSKYPLGYTQVLGSRGTKWNTCAILGWRGQEGGPTESDVKNRVVWMYPFGLNVAELQVYQPLIEQFQKFDLVPAWNGLESVYQRMTKLFDTKGPDDLVVCTDFTKFDQHFNSTCQQGAFTIIEALLNGSEYSVQWLNDVFPLKYNIALMYDYGKCAVGPHGMGSGSGGTNFDETILHRALQYEAALANGSRLNTNSMCLGDDGILTYPGISVDDVVKSYASHGLEMNPDKQYAATDHCVYLRRWYHTSYRRDGLVVGVYSTYRALGRLRYLERFSLNWSPEMVALRQLSILENCSEHPLFTEFVQFCMKGDKYKLGLTLPGFLDNLASLYKDATDAKGQWMGYMQQLDEESNPAKGIYDWKIVQYLLSLRESGHEG